MESRHLIFVEPHLRFIASREPWCSAERDGYDGPALGAAFAVRFSADTPSGDPKTFAARLEKTLARPVTLLTAGLWLDIIAQVERLEASVKAGDRDAPTAQQWHALADRWRRLADAVDEAVEEDGGLPE